MKKVEIFRFDICHPRSQDFVDHRDRADLKPHIKQTLVGDLGEIPYDCAFWPDPDNYAEALEEKNCQEQWGWSYFFGIRRVTFMFLDPRKAVYYKLLWGGQ